MGERDALLDAMSLAAYTTATTNLSGPGRAALRRLDSARKAAKHSNVLDAYVEANGTASLSERDKSVIEAYLARRTLIEHFR
jgi:hypothetical protein